MTGLPILRFGALFAMVGVMASCSGESTSSSTMTPNSSATSRPSSSSVDGPDATTTTTPPPADPRMLAASDLGAGFEDRPYRFDDQRRGPCPLALPDTPVLVERLGAGFTSNAALEQATVELVVHADAAAASVAYAAAQRDSACTGEENREEGTPRPRGVAGADEAFSIGHVTTNDGVFSEDLATRAVDRLG